MIDESSGAAAEGSPHLIHGDVSAGLDLVENASVQLVLTSPPYNLRKTYERDEAMSLDDYLEWLTPVIELLCKKVSDTGSICWQVGNYVKDGEVFPLDYFFYEIFRRQGLKLRNRIIWRFNFGLHATKRLSGRHETLLWFTKTDDYKFNLDPIRVPQLYPGKRHSKAKGETKAGKPSGNPLGKNPSDFWTFSAEESFREQPIWEIPNVKANHPEQTVHPCQFPHELAERCVLALTDEGDAVLDPFMGAGTSIIAALRARRRATGIDKSLEYVELTRRRIADFEAGILPLRPSASGVAAPSRRQRVARKPDEWVEAAE